MREKTIHELRVDAWFAERDAENRAHMGPKRQWMHKHRRLIGWAVMWLFLLPLMYVLPTLLAFVLIVWVLSALTVDQRGRLPGKEYGP